MLQRKGVVKPSVSLTVGFVSLVCRRVHAGASALNLAVRALQWRRSCVPGWRCVCNVRSGVERSRPTSTSLRQAMGCMQVPQTGRPSKAGAPAQVCKRSAAAHRIGRWCRPGSQRTRCRRYRLENGGHAGIGWVHWGSRHRCSGNCVTGVLPCCWHAL